MSIKIIFTIIVFHFHITLLRYINFIALSTIYLVLGIGRPTLTKCLPAVMLQVDAICSRHEYKEASFVSIALSGRFITVLT